MGSGNLLFPTSCGPWPPFPLVLCRRDTPHKGTYALLLASSSSIEASLLTKQTGPYMSLQVLLGFVHISHPRNALPSHILHHVATLHPPSGFQLRYDCFENTSLTHKFGSGALLMAFWAPWTCPMLAFTTLCCGCLFTVSTPH